MTRHFPPLSPKCPHFLHGGDYNPDQWRHMPEILDEDVRLMKLSGCNAMSTAIFAWTALEPEEGRFEFGWLDNVMDKLADNGVYVVLATPSGARPAWMARKYPEVLRVGADRRRILYCVRHNHCYTSPLYRRKCAIINRKLAERYKDHPALILWHISNEYGGECHCELCQDAFRNWLKKRYDKDLDQLNRAWWTSFWSHTYTDWSQIESPAPHGEMHLHGLTLDWKRFVTDQTIDFYLNEIKPLREITPDVKITTNLMGTYLGLDGRKIARHLDVVSWDSYPSWRAATKEDVELASSVAFHHDLNRSLRGGQPFMLMESTPSVTNWQLVPKLKRPGLHFLSSMQAVAHGSDTVQYFQWRKGQGSWEKFHGAVVDHCGHENTRVFRDVAQVGEALKKMDCIVGTTTPAEVGLIFDWENAWAIHDACGPRREKKDYLPTCVSHHRAFWKRGIAVDVIGMDDDFSRYKLLIAPMLYMIRPGVADRIQAFVSAGGSFVATYLTGITDENDRCHLGGFPGPLRKLLGIWAEEIDALYDDDRNHVVMTPGNPLRLEGEFEASIFCDLIHAETAEVAATYRDDFYAGRPALTRNRFGKGAAWYMASRNEERFLQAFYDELAAHLKLARALDTDLPEGVTAHMRTDGSRVFVFLMNFAQEERTIVLGNGKFRDLLADKELPGRVTLPCYGCLVLERR